MSNFHCPGNKFTSRTMWQTQELQPRRRRRDGFADATLTANSDRRPVDPPPVVELRIIEGSSVEDGKDITFDYNANFFLYASLEQARTIAHGRVQTSAASNPPILTGVPASGMAYLDRPVEAGYFIFPDLSVRHEGYFRLSFSLFETTKEDKDHDLDQPDSDLPQGVDWRMEIKTLPFNVFSAKKFPGLMESTQLSKTVADQGCRVRIRRDVRMRKRDGKSGAYERRDDDYPRRRTVTPASDDPIGAMRPRSLSNSSEQRGPSMTEAARRPTAADHSYTSARPGPVATTAPVYEAAQTSSKPGHLSFGEGPASHCGVVMGRRQSLQPGMPMSPVSPSGSCPASQPAFGGHHNRTASSAALSSKCPSPTLSTKQEPYERGSILCVLPTPSAYATADNRQRKDLCTTPSPGTPLLPMPAGNRQVKAERPTSTAALKISSLVSPLPPMEVQMEEPPSPPGLGSGGKRKHELVFQPSLRSLQHGHRHQESQAGRCQLTDAGHGTYSRADGKLGFVTFNQWR